MLRWRSVGSKIKNQKSSILNRQSKEFPDDWQSAWRATLGRMDRCYREQVEDLVVFAADDPARAAAEFHIRGAYLSADEGLPPAAGQVYRLRVGAFFEIRGGKISRVTNHYNLAEWLRQVGA